MFVEDWDMFLEQAEALYRSAPLRTRYVLKYRHCDGKLVLKVTDDVACLKYYTDQQSDLKRVEALNQLFFRLMALGADAPAEDVVMTPAESQPQQKQQPVRQKQQQAGSRPGGASGGGKKAKRRG